MSVLDVCLIVGFLILMWRLSFLPATLRWTHSCASA